MLKGFESLPPTEPQPWEDHRRKGELVLDLSTDAAPDDEKAGGSEALAEMGLPFLKSTMCERSRRRIRELPLRMSLQLPDPQRPQLQTAGWMPSSDSNFID